MGGYFTLDQPYRFSTKRYYPAIGLTYYGYRFYSASLGRWMTRDPLGEAGGINLYGAMSNNPVNFIDPMGLSDAFMYFVNDGSLSLSYTFENSYLGFGRGSYYSHLNSSRGGSSNVVTMVPAPDVSYSTFHNVGYGKLTLKNDWKAGTLYTGGEA